MADQAGPAPAARRHRRGRHPRFFAAERGRGFRAQWRADARLYLGAGGDVRRFTTDGRPRSTWRDAGNVADDRRSPRDRAAGTIPGEGRTRTAPAGIIGGSAPDPRTSQ